MANTLKLEIVTPESKIYSEDVEMVTPVSYTHLTLPTNKEV